jgi:hypothetical protein
MRALLFDAFGRHAEEAPMLLEDPLTEAGAWTLLAAVYDLHAEAVGSLAMISPELHKSEPKSGAFFDLLKDRLRCAAWSTESGDNVPGPMWSYDTLIEEALRLVGATARPKRPKRSTQKGEGRAKLIAALTKHHDYADGGALNLDPIGNNALADLAVVDKATASAFFKKEFGGHEKYKVACRDANTLVTALKLLNGEFAPHLLFGSRPPGESDGEDE